MGDTANIEKDLVHLARVALSGRAQDVNLLLRRIAKGYRETAPALAEQVTALLREAPTLSSPLRRQTEAALPVDVDTRLQLLRVEERPVLDHEPISQTTSTACSRAWWTKGNIVRPCSTRG